MKRKLKYIVFIVSILILYVSCKGALLEPSRIPPPAVFPKKNIIQTNVEVTHPGITVDKIEVNPVVSPDGAVFGGFVKRFKFKGDWYVMADRMYKYNADNTLTRTAEGILLKVEENKIIIIGKDLKYRSAWNYLNRIGSDTVEYSPTIEADRLIIEANNQGSYKSDNTPPYAPHNATRGYISKLFRSKTTTTTTDLINWSSTVVDDYYFNFPKPDYNWPPRDYFNPMERINWQGRVGIGTHQAKLIYFKGYLYVLGGCYYFNDVNPNGNRPVDAGPYSSTVGTIKRIKIDIDNTPERNIKVVGGWEEYDAPFGQRENISADISYDGNSMCISGGYRDRWVSTPLWSHETAQTFNDTWETTDGKSWKKTDYFQVYDNGFDSFKAITRLVPTPAEPRWAKVKGYNYYAELRGYKTAIDYITNDIMNYALRDELEFPTANYDDIIINSHIRDILIYSNNGGKVSYHQINSKNKISTNFIWTGSYYNSDISLFNINNNLVRLIDYDYLGGYYYNTDIVSKKTLDWYSNEAYRFREGIYITSTNETGIHKYIQTNINGSLNKATNYNQRDFIYFAMYYDAQKYINEYHYTNKRKLMPNKPVTHYTIEFEY